jgi:quercetin dioxygenase-like cupin family protein
MLSLAVVLGLGAGLAAVADEAADGHAILTPADLAWKPGPPSLPAGAKMVVLHGDPSKEGLFTMRLQVSAGYKVPPHWHPANEHVTVLDGTVIFGMGDKVDEKTGKTLPAGGFFFMPAKHHHWALAKTDATIQIHGQGPWAIHYLNPADDPRSEETRK